MLSTFRSLFVLNVLSAGSISNREEAVACDFPRLDARSSSDERKFVATYRGKQPVMFEGVTQDWPVMTWNMEDWQRALSNVTLPRRRLSTVASGGAVHSAQTLSSEAFFNSSGEFHGDQAMVFSTSRTDPAVLHLTKLGIIQVPALFKDVSLHPVLSIGKAREGLPYHSHEEAWLALLHGSKNWYLLPPNANPASRHHRVEQASLANEPGVLQCEQHMGQVVYFPSGWWHATYNGAPAPQAITIGMGGLGLRSDMLSLFLHGDIAGLENKTRKDQASMEFALKEGGTWAAKVGHVDLISWLIKHRGALSKQVDSEGKDLLHKAAVSGHLPVVLKLFEYRASLNAASHEEKRGQPALHLRPTHIAAENGHVELLSWLLDNRARVDPPAGDAMKLGPLGRASGAGHKDVVNWLIEKQTAVVRDELAQSHRPLFAAATSGHEGVISLLIQYVKKLGTVGKVDYIMMSHVATANGRAKVLSWLLDQGVRVDSEGKDGVQPVHLAAQSGHSEVLAVLFDRGATNTAKDVGGAQPLHWAGYNGHVKVVRWLLSHGAQIGDKDGYKKDVTHAAASGGHLKTLSFLFKHRAELSGPDGSGTEPMHAAAESGHVKVLKWLSKQRARLLDEKRARSFGHASVSQWIMARQAKSRSKEL